MPYNVCSTQGESYLLLRMVSVRNYFIVERILPMCKSMLFKIGHDVIYLTRLGLTRNIPGEQGQYHGYRYPGSLRCQDTSGHSKYIA